MANYISIAKKIKASPKVLRETRKKVQTKLDQEEAILFQNFENHPVTKEILGGSSSRNISGTLVGYGNLFSFIGFSEGSGPIGPVRQILRSAIRIRSIRKAAGNKINIKIGVPDLEDFRAASPLPWEPGRSWVEAIERGISGFGYYINSRRTSSRSGMGVQIENKVRVMAFKNIKYMSEIIRNFTKNLRNIK